MTTDWSTLAIGISLVLGGALALLASVLTTFVSMFLLGGVLLAVGFLEIVSAIRIRRTGMLAVYLVAGILSFAVGTVFVFAPLTSLASVTLLIGAYFFTSGMFRGVTAIVDRYPAWGWQLGYAIGCIGLGASVVALWPISSFWTIGALVATEIIARGIVLVVAAFEIRRVVLVPVA